jgi:hypothetical protein
MRFQISGQGWPVGPWLIPAGTVIDNSQPTGWAAVVAGRAIPLNATALDGEAVAALAAEIARTGRSW